MVGTMQMLKVKVLGPIGETVSVHLLPVSDEQGATITIDQTMCQLGAGRARDGLTVQIELMAPSDDPGEPMPIAAYSPAPLAMSAGHARLVAEGAAPLVLVADRGAGWKVFENTDWPPNLFNAPTDLLARQVPIDDPGQLSRIARAARKLVGR